ncbi:hypothetical protein LOK46_27685 [Methylobacterium sp. NMS14P]|uniref:hypothetical protein n=1 Tax=Methylobacterium sp. NMS14P TaxID=2894310 RepID=UPI0023584054|nr:hypothetical protein [Methylobacterium sp. NMS14P]WCS24865.1 hypothetical protein LOK46_27685 [Methylobacterium sp. NMS14P]
MTVRTPKSIRGLLRGTRGDGVLTLELFGSAVAMHAAPAWSFDDLLDLDEVLGPGLYILVGLGEGLDARSRAIVGEGGLVRERLAAHAADPKLDWVYEAVVVTGPRVLSEVIRLCLQRRLADELVLGGGIGRVVGHDPERATASSYEMAAAERILEDIRALAGLVSPGLMADVTPVLEPISSRPSMLPRGVDAVGLTWTTHEMAYAGARARASMLGRETIVLPGSTIVAASRGTSKWLPERKAELLGRGVLTGHADARLLRLTTFVKFRTAQEATAFVSGGACASACLTWRPVEDR